MSAGRQEVIKETLEERKTERHEGDARGKEDRRSLGRHWRTGRLDNLKETLENRST